MTMGILYGVGVGPGDPELLTLKAARVLGSVRVVFAASSSRNDYSTSLDIARPHLAPGARVERLAFPMTRDRAALEAAWDRNADLVLETLAQGLDAAFLTLGDPMTYSTFGYLMRTIRSKNHNATIQVVPGISSYQAAAAEAGQVLAEGEETLAVVSGALGGDNVRRVAAWADRLVVLKAYKRFGEIRGALAEAGRLKEAAMVSNCGMADQALVRDLDQVAAQPGYFTLILAGNGRKPVADLPAEPGRDRRPSSESVEKK